MSVREVDENDEYEMLKEAYLAERDDDDESGCWMWLGKVFASAMRWWDD